MMHLLFALLLWLSPNLSVQPTEDTTVFAPTELHDFHVSKCIVEHSREDNALQITLHIFIDDLEEALEAHGADQLFLCTKKESEKADQYLYNYLRQKVQFTMNEQVLSYNYIGKEVSEDLQAVWCYLEIEGINDLKPFNISNNLLMELFDDQKNIINIRAEGRSKGYFLFEKGNSSKLVTW